MALPKHEFRGRFNLNVTAHLVPMRAPFICPPGEHPGTPELLQFAEYVTHDIAETRQVLETQLGQVFGELTSLRALLEQRLPGSATRGSLCMDD